MSRKIFKIQHECLKGISITFDTHQLPLLTLWKNTDTEKLIAIE
ncbi:hypothetical protein [Pectobacterium carotovorum]|nr:hypothetical protein [Pectobacterium carotovorum]